MNGQVDGWLLGLKDGWMNGWLDNECMGLRDGG